MKVAFDLLEQINAAGITLEAGSDGKLIAKASHNKLTSQWCEQIADMKSSLLAVIDLQARIHLMAQRWQYSEANIAEVMSLARQDPEAWLRAVVLDERRFANGEHQ